MPQRILHHPFCLALASALSRTAEIPVLGWMWGLLAAGASALGQDLFTGIFLLTGVCSALDLAAGAKVARYEKRYSAERKRRGRDQKIVTLQLLIVFRLLELWAASKGLLVVADVLRWIGLDRMAESDVAARGGVISALICAGVCYDEMESWEGNRRRLGGKRIWVLSTVFEIGRAMQDRVQARVVPAKTEPAP